MALDGLQYRHGLLLIPASRNLTSIKLPTFEPWTHRAVRSKWKRPGDLVLLARERSLTASSYRTSAASPARAMATPFRSNRIAIGKRALPGWTPTTRTSIRASTRLTAPSRQDPKPQTWHGSKWVKPRIFEFRPNCGWDRGTVPRRISHLFDPLPPLQAGE